MYEAFPYPAYGVPSFGSINHDIDAILLCTGKFNARLSRLQVLDVGCGTGEKTVGCALIYPEVSIVGVDLSSGSIARAQALAASHKCTNVSFVRGEITTLAKELGKFDVVISVGAAMLVESPEQFIHALAQCLRPSGVLSLYMYAPYGRQLLAQLQRLTELLCDEDESLGMRADIASVVLAELESRPAYKEFLTQKSFLAPQNRALRGRATQARIADQLLQPKEQHFDLFSIERMLKAAGLELRGFLDDLSATQPSFHNDELRARFSRLSLAARKEATVLAQGDVNEYKLVATLKDSGQREEQKITEESIPRARRTLLEFHPRFVSPALDSYSTPVLGYTCDSVRYSVSRQLLNLIRNCDGAQTISDIYYRIEDKARSRAAVIDALKRLAELKIILMAA